MQIYKYKKIQLSFGELTETTGLNNSRAHGKQHKKTKVTVLSTFKVQISSDLK